LLKKTKPPFSCSLFILAILSCMTIPHTLTYAHDNIDDTRTSGEPDNRRVILFIGDSHVVGNFGHALTEIMTTGLPDSAITTVAACGSSPSWWLTEHKISCGFWRHDSNGREISSREDITPKLERLINEIRPDLIIIALGTNLLAMKNNDQHSEIISFLNALNGKTSQCIWIGPPDTSRFKSEQINNVYYNLNKLTAKSNCHLIDSRKYTIYPNSESDGIHYNGENGRRISKEWAENIFRKKISLIANEYPHSPHNRK
jgi:lysophospholipase L1-like esterase